MQIQFRDRTGLPSEIAEENDGLNPAFIEAEFSRIKKYMGRLCDEPPTKNRPPLAALVLS
jgi:hypothetical protein